MPNILCNITLNKEAIKQIQQKINAGFTIEQIVDELGISISL